MYVCVCVPLNWFNCTRLQRFICFCGLGCAIAQLFTVHTWHSRYKQSSKYFLDLVAFTTLTTIVRLYFRWVDNCCCWYLCVLIRSHLSSVISFLDSFSFSTFSSLLIYCFLSDAHTQVQSHSHTLTTPYPRCAALLRGRHFLRHCCCCCGCCCWCLWNSIVFQSAESKRRQSK